MLKKIILPIILFMSLPLLSQQNDQETIQKLINEVRDSQAIFIRNNEEHSSQEAAEHLEGKWRRAKSFLWFKTRAKEFTPEQFITHIASKSSFSGESYQIKFKNGKTILTETWLNQKLSEISKNQKKITKEHVKKK